MMKPPSASLAPHEWSVRASIVVVSGRHVEIEAWCVECNQPVNDIAEHIHPMREWNKLRAWNDAISDDATREVERLCQ